MTPAPLRKLDKQLGGFLDAIPDGMGRPERRRAMSWYLMGLLLDGERKTAVSMRGLLVEEDCEAEAMRQRLQQCVTISTRADEEVRKRLREHLELSLKVEAYVVDDIGLPKKGKAAVGVSRQYSGTVGRVDNCQVATSLHVASNACPRTGQTAPSGARRLASLRMGSFARSGNWHWICSTTPRQAELLLA